MYTYGNIGFISHKISHSNRFTMDNIRFAIFHRIYQPEVLVIICYNM